MFKQDQTGAPTSDVTPMNDLIGDIPPVDPDSSLHSTQAPQVINNEYPSLAPCSSTSPNFQSGKEKLDMTTANDCPPKQYPCPTPSQFQSLPSGQAMVHVTEKLEQDNYLVQATPSSTANPTSCSQECDEAWASPTVLQSTKACSQQQVQDSFPVFSSSSEGVQNSSYSSNETEISHSDEVMGHSLLDEHSTSESGGCVISDPVPTPTSRDTIPQEPEQCAVRNLKTKPRDLTVTANLNGQDIKALVDTGAAISVIDECFLQDLYGGHVPPLQKEALGELKTVSGEALPVIGRFVTTIEIAGGIYSCTFVVVRDLTYDALLGRDFLRANGAVINLKDGTLLLDSNSDEHPQERACPVRVFSTCVIPPSSEAVIPASLDSNYAPGDVGLIEASMHLIERYHLQGAAALVALSAGHTIPFRLINPTSKPVTLYRGATLGTFVPADDTLQVLGVDAHPNTSQQQSSDSNDVPIDLIDADLTDTQKEALQRLINEYRDIFALSPHELGRTNLVQHHINTENHAPIRQRAYRVPDAQKKRIEQCIDEMMEQGIIQPSTSPWSSPIVLVRKPDGSDRFCCDFRRINSITKKDSYPLPRIAETLDALNGSQLFSSVDLRSGYWQIELDDASREKTAFITHAGLYEFNVMPFGLCNAPSCFQRLMECVLRGLTWKIALIYLDDVLVYSRTFEDHLQHLRLVFDRFRESGLKLKPNKCHFGQKKVKFLGHIISKDGVYPDTSDRAE